MEVPLRRGGWYRVSSHTAIEAVVSTEGGKTVSVPRPYLDKRGHNAKERHPGPVQLGR
jgi:hypothetical protein